MVLKLVRETAPSIDTTARPHTTALRETLKAITDLRVKLNTLHAKDRLARADQALAEATTQQMQSVQREIDVLRAEHAYSNLSSPDTRPQEKKLLALSQTLKRQQDTARAAVLISAKFQADIQRLNDEIVA